MADIDSTSDGETVTLTIDAPDGASDEVTLPSRLMAMLAEEDQTPAEVAGDLALFSCAQRVHATIHHTDGEVAPEMEEIERTAMDLFKARFGMTFGEAVGHEH